MTRVTLTLNGRPRSAEIEPRETLADFLRDQCHLTATHLGCEQGACGACTVLLDGQPARACIHLAVMTEGRDVRSLEGLKDDSLIALLRRHFHEAHGLQCGYCTPGMLITARDIIARFPQPDERLIRQELAGQICRCTGYVGIVEAIRRAGAELAQNAAANPPPP